MLAKLNIFYGIKRELSIKNLSLMKNCMLVQQYTEDLGAAAEPMKKYFPAISAVDDVYWMRRIGKELKMKRSRCFCMWIISTKCITAARE